MLKIDQSDRHIINVPIPFTEEQLSLLVKYFNGFQDPETVKDYVDNIIKEGRVVLEPSHELGDGATIADIFSFGFMVLMKNEFKVDVNPALLWWHPGSQHIPKKIPEINIEFQEVELESNEYVMTTAIDGDGNIVRAEDIMKARDEEE